MKKECVTKEVHPAIPCELGIFALIRLRIANAAATMEGVEQEVSMEDEQFVQFVRSVRLLVDLIEAQRRQYTPPPKGRESRDDAATQGRTRSGVRNSGDARQSAAG